MDIISVTDIPMETTLYLLDQTQLLQKESTNIIFTSSQQQQTTLLYEKFYNENPQHQQQEQENDCRFFNFIWACALMVLCYLGYIGNMLSFLALNRDRRNSATMLLQALSISDIVLLISVNITDAVPYYCDYIGSCVNPWKSWPPIRYIWLLTPIGHMCSIWLVVLVAANRFWAVCKPHSTAEVWSNKRTLIYIVVAISTAFIFNVPRFFEYEIIEISDDNLEYSVQSFNGNEVLKEKNQSSIMLHTMNMDKMYNGVNTAHSNVSNLDFKELNRYQRHENFDNHNNATNKSFKNPMTSSKNKNYRLQEQTTTFGNSKFYKVGYKVFLVNTFLVIIPIPLQFITSLWIIRSLKSSVKRSRSQNRASGKARSISVKSGSSDDAGNDKNEIKTPGNIDNIKNSNEEKEGQIMLLGKNDEKNSSKKRTESKKVAASREITFLLVAVILVAVACQTPLALFHFVRYVHTYKCGDLVYYLESASKFLVNVNSCINFVLYCVLSPKFRRLLTSLVTCRTAENKSRSCPLLNNERSIKLARTKKVDDENFNECEEQKKLLGKPSKEGNNDEDDDETKELVAVVVAETPTSTKIETVTANEGATVAEIAVLLSGDDNDDKGEDEKP